MNPVLQTKTGMSYRTDEGVFIPEHTLYRYVDENGKGFCWYANINKAADSWNRAYPNNPAPRHLDSPNPPCAYCGEPLTMSEYDFEDNRFYSSHFRCSQETPNGRFEVVTYFNGEKTDSSPRRYTTAKRAISQAEYLSLPNSPSSEFIVYDHSPESDVLPAPVAIAHFVGQYSPLVKEA